MSKLSIVILISSIVLVSCGSDRGYHEAGLSITMETPADSQLLYISYQYRDTLHIDTLMCDGRVELELSLPTDSFSLVTLISPCGDSKRVWIYNDKRVKIEGDSLNNIAQWRSDGDQWNSWRDDFDHQCSQGEDTLSLIDEFVREYPDQPATTLLLSDYAYYGSANNRLIGWVEQLTGRGRYNPIFKDLAIYCYSGRELRVGAALTDFPPETKDRYWISNAASRGKHVLFYITASWSDSSRVANRRLSHLYRNYRDKGIEMFGWSLDPDFVEFQSMIRQDSIEFRMVREEKGMVAPIVSFCALSHLPSIYIVNPSGILIHRDISVAQAEKIIANICR